eukprot:365233-Chlamydomonas_euryale.AAC.8
MSGRLNEQAGIKHTAALGRHEGVCGPPVQNSSMSPPLESVSCRGSTSTCGMPGMSKVRARSSELCLVV